jgi:hypothetical protein
MNSHIYSNMERFNIAVLLYIWYIDMYWHRKFRFGVGFVNGRKEDRK